MNDDLDQNKLNGGDEHEEGQVPENQTFGLLPDNETINAKIKSLASGFERDNVDPADLRTNYRNRSNYFTSSRPRSPAVMSYLRTISVDNLSEIKLFEQPGLEEPSKWLAVGPRNINGRVKCIAVHPKNPQIIFIGAANGGLWKTEDAGRHWVKFWPENFPKAIGSIDLYYDESGNAGGETLQILVGTGEPVGLDHVGWFHNFPGNGLYYHNGLKWTHIPYPDPPTDFKFYTFTKVLFSFNDSSTFYAAGPDGFYKIKYTGESPSLQTIDLSDEDWSWVHVYKGSRVSDAVRDPINPKVVYFTKIDDNDGNPPGLYWSKDGVNFENFNLKINGDPIPWEWAKISVSDHAKELTTRFFALKIGVILYSVYRDGDQITVDIIYDSIAGQFIEWCATVAIKPKRILPFSDEPYIEGDFIVLVGSRNMLAFRGSPSKAGAAGKWTFLRESNEDELHIDQQQVVIPAHKSGITYLVNDGGVFKSKNLGRIWCKISHGLQITQFYAVGNWPSYETVIGGGTQDQGSAATEGGLTWDHILPKTDGGYVLFEDSNPYKIFAEKGWINIWRSRNGGSNFAQLLAQPCGGGDDNIFPSSQWLKVLIQTIVDGDSFYYTGDRWIYRLNTKSSPNFWYPISKELLTDEETFFSSIVIAESNPNRLYAGTGNLRERTSGGEIHIFTCDKARTVECGDNEENWKEINVEDLGGKQPITSIVVHPFDEDQIFVGLGWNYDLVEGPDVTYSIPAGFIYRGVKKTDVPPSESGIVEFTWDNLTPIPDSNFPLSSVNSLLITKAYPNLLFAGTDVGIFVLDLNIDLDSSDFKWKKMGQGFPVNVVSDIKYDKKYNSLYAATFGQGLYRLYLNDIAKRRVYLRSNKLDTGENQVIPLDVLEPLYNDASQERKTNFWSSPDIKILDQEKYDELLKIGVDDIDPNDIDGIEFDKIEESEIEIGKNYFILVQAHNRGPESGSEVKLSLFMGEGELGELPDNYAEFGDFSQNEKWKLVGGPQRINNLEANDPQILMWFLPSLSVVPERLNLFSVITSLNDPYNNPSRDPQELASRERKAALKSILKNPPMSTKPKSPKDYFLENQGFAYGALFALLILLLGKFVLFDQCCNGTITRCANCPPVTFPIFPEKPTEGGNKFCEPVNARILISLKNLTVTTDVEGEFFKSYENKVEIMKHKNQVNDPAFIGYDLCGSIPGVGCNEPPPPDLFGVPVSGHDYKNGGSLLGTSILDVNQQEIDKEAPLLAFYPCKNDPKKFITITTLDLNFEEIKARYVGDLTCLGNAYECNSSSLPFDECLAVVLDQPEVDPIKWEDDVFVERFTIRALHADHEINIEPYYFTILKVGNNKIMRIGYNKPTTLINRIIIE